MSVLYHPRATPAAFTRPQPVFLVDVIIPAVEISGGMSGPGSHAERSVGGGAVSGPVQGVPAPTAPGISGLRVYQDHVYDKGVYSWNEVIPGEGTIIPEQHFRWSNYDYAMLPTDATPRLYDGRLRDPGSLERSISLSPLENASITVNGGQIILVNSDGALDTIMDDMLMRGCLVEIRHGIAGTAWAALPVVSRMRADSWDVSLDEATITLADAGKYFDANVNFTVYTGHGGINGPEDLVGQMRPIVLGAVYNMAPILVDEVKQIYQIHDGSLTAVAAVKDGGIPLALQGNVADYVTLEATAVSPGKYLTCLAHGCVKLGSIPVFRVTVDATGRGAGAASIALSLAQEVVANAGLDVPIALDVAAFNAMIAARNESVGWVVTEPTTYRTLIDLLLGSIVCFWGAARDGRITVRPLDPPDPSAAVVTSYDVVDLIEIDRIAMPPGFETGHRSRTVLYDRNWEPMAGSGVAAAAPQRARLARQWASSTSAAQVQMRAAITPPNVETPLRTALGAQRAGVRIQSLHGMPRQMFLFTAGLQHDDVLPELADQVEVTHPRFGLSGGRVLRVVSVREEYDEGTITVTAWG